jgi:spore coat protein SA
MKLLMIAPEQIPVPPLSGGSVENCMIQIAQGLKKEHHVTIVSRRDPHYPKVTKLGNLTILRVPTGSPAKYLSNVLHLVKGNRYDMIQVDNRPAYLDQVRRNFPKTPISLFLHSTTFISAHKISPARASRLMAKANLIVGNSQSLKVKISSMFPKYRKRIRFVHLGVDHTQFRPPTQWEKNKVRMEYDVHSSFNVVFAGRLTPQKGIPILIEAVFRLKEAIPHIRLIIAGGVGSRSYIHSLRSMAESKGISYTFLGKVPRQRMHEVYWMGDCFVCPSQGHEAFGLVNVEALASGTPVVASRNGGICEIIQHDKNGLLVEDYTNPDNFAQAILQLKDEQNLAERLSLQGRIDAVTHFNWSNTAKNLMRIYQMEK